MSNKTSRYSWRRYKLFQRLHKVKNSVCYTAQFHASCNPGVCGRRIMPAATQDMDFSNDTPAMSLLKISLNMNCDRNCMKVCTRHKRLSHRQNYFASDDKLLEWKTGFKYNSLSLPDDFNSLREFFNFKLNSIRLVGSFSR